MENGIVKESRDSRDDNSQYDLTIGKLALYTKFAAKL